MLSNGALHTKLVCSTLHSYALPQDGVRHTTLYGGVPGLLPAYKTGFRQRAGYQLPRPHPLIGTRVNKAASDRGYNGKIGEWIKERLGWALEIVKPPRRWVRVPANEEPPPYPAGFKVVLPRRWVIERTIAWIMRNRRMSRDYYEFLSETTEALNYVAMIRLMLRRLAKAVS
jgi:transposase